MIGLAQSPGTEVEPLLDQQRAVAERCRILAASSREQHRPLRIVVGQGDRPVSTDRLADRDLPEFLIGRRFQRAIAFSHREASPLSGSLSCATTLWRGDDGFLGSANVVRCAT